jgi:hypothetical protein
MSAGFFRRFGSSIVDFIIVFIVVYLAFAVGGRTLLRNRVDYFDQRYFVYQELLDVYNDDLSAAQTEYNANMEVAGDDADAQADAQSLYNLKTSILNMQNTADIQPYNVSLTGYYVEIISFFAFGVVVAVGILAMSTKGRTPGRLLLQLKLVTNQKGKEPSKPNVIQILLHDSLVKYLILALVFAYSIYYGFIFILFSLFLDAMLMSMTRSKSTLRDFASQIRVVRANK